jgi:hypothetical protein
MWRCVVWWTGTPQASVPVYQIPRRHVRKDRNIQNLCTSDLSHIVLSLCSASSPHLCVKRVSYMAEHLLPMTQQPLVDQSLLITEASRSHPTRHTTLDSIPLDEWSARNRDLYLTTHNIRKRQTSVLPANSNPQFQQVSGRRPTP